MRYTIISLNDERSRYKDAIRSNLSLSELDLPAVDGKEVDIDIELNVRGLHSLWHNAKVGEVGVWLSNFDRWLIASKMTEPLIVFEDDAIVGGNFMSDIELLTSELPEDWDFVSLWVPENQRIDYGYDLHYNEIGDPVITGYRTLEDSLFRVSEHVARVYQGYGMVALMYSPSGASKLVNLARSYGAYTPVDCFIYQQAHMGNLNGYAPPPWFAEIVKYDWLAETHVQKTERYK